MLVTCEIARHCPKTYESHAKNTAQVEKSVSIMAGKGDLKS